MAQEKKAEPTREVKDRIVKMVLEKEKFYRLELAESAAAYHAHETFVPCLQKSIKEKKTATLKVTVYSLNVVECKN